LKIKSQKDFFAGLMFFVMGTAFGWGSTNYTVGEAARMGPGYFPLMLGTILAIIGAIIMLTALIIETEDGEKIGSWAWRPLFFIISANVAFGMMIGGLPKIGLPAMGMIIGIYALTFIAGLAANTFKFKEVAILATVLATGSYLAFVVLLKLQFPVWPTFLTR